MWRVNEAAVRGASTLEHLAISGQHDASLPGYQQLDLRIVTATIAMGIKAPQPQPRHQRTEPHVRENARPS